MRDAWLALVRAAPYTLVFRNAHPVRMTYLDHPSPLLGFGCLAVLGLGINLVRLPMSVVRSHGRLAALDGLRGVLALAVFLHHFFISYQWKHSGTWKVPPTHTYDMMGSCSVALFFMITGFLFFGKIKATRGRLNLNVFFIGRLFRLVPVYLVCVVLVYVAALTQTGFTLDGSLQSSLDEWLFFQGGTINGYNPTILINAGVHWTLLYEWLFYFSVPVFSMAWTALRFGSWAVFLLSIATLWMTKSSVQLPVIQMSGIFLAPFALGGLAGEVGRSRLLRHYAQSFWGSAASLLAVAAVFVLCTTAYSVSGFMLLFAVFTPIALGNTLFGVLRTRTLTMLGEISYDIYLLHGVALFYLYSIIMPDALQSASTPGRLFSLLLIAGGCTLVLAVLTHLLVERPLLRLGRKIVAIDSTQELSAP